MTTQSSIPRPEDDDDVYDARRALRREITLNVEKAKGKAPDEILEAIMRADLLYGQCTFVRDVNQEAKALSKLVEIVSNSISETKAGSRLSMTELGQAFVEKYPTESSEGWQIDLSALAKEFGCLMHRAPTCDFLFGPANVEVKARTNPKKRQKVQDAEHATANEYKNAVQNGEEGDLDTLVVVRTQAMLEQFKTLNERDPNVGILDLVLCKDFNETCEKMFYLSTLVSHRRLSLRSMQGDDIVNLSVVTGDQFRNVKESDKAMVQQVNRQAILSIDYCTWEKLYEKKFRKSVHRKH